MFDSLIVQCGCGIIGREGDMPVTEIPSVVNAGAVAEVLISSHHSSQ